MPPGRAGGQPVTIRSLPALGSNNLLGTYQPTFPIWLPRRRPIEGTVVGFLSQGEPDQPAEGSLSGIPARSAGPTGGGEAISAHGPTCRARFARPLADAGGQPGA